MLLAWMQSASSSTCKPLTCRVFRSVWSYSGRRHSAVASGTAMFGHRNVETGEEEPGPRELVRLAIPSRVCTQSHVDYLIEVVEEVFRAVNT